MRNLLHTFYGKLSAVFLILLVAMGIALTAITLRTSSRYIAEVDQRLNLGLAGDMASEIEPFLGDTIRYENIEEAIHYMMVMNPKVEIYLLNAEGRILSFFAEPGKTVQAKYVALKPVKQFLSGERKTPTLGEDPRQPDKRKPFSVSPLSLGENESGYLYIIIGGEQYETAAQMVMESYIVRTTLTGLLITLGFTGLIGLILFAFLTKRIRRMSKTVKSFEQRNHEARIDVTSEDEIGQLGESFNQMADTIVANMEDLKRTDKLRRELIANVSHDLRSPLASIQGYLETILMKEASLPQEKRKQFLELILNDTQMLNKLVHELFELSKLEAEETKPSVEPFPIAELIQDVVMKFQDQAEKANLSLSSTLPSNLPMVSADIAMIERALSNLIDNAIHYTPAGGEINVILTRDTGWIQVAVEDNGPGIPEEDLPFIFERFYRGEKSRTSKSGSTGLGLAIAKKIVDLHDGTLSVNSTLGEGSTFTFKLGIYDGE